MRILLGRNKRRAAILLLAEQRIEKLWREVDAYDQRQVQRFTEQAAEIMISSQQQVVSLTTATQLRYLEEVGVELKDFLPEVPDDVRMYSDRGYEFAKPAVASVRGVSSKRLPTNEVFYRPAKTYRAKVAAGNDVAKALEQSVDRAKLLVGTNLALAEREATFQILDEANLAEKIGWRRVIHPEASTGGVCGLCIAASDRIYGVKDLKPLHDRCNCEVLPVTTEHDPGKELNEADLSRLYDAAGGTAARLLKRTRYKLDQHGELGPVLVPERRGESVPHFTIQDPETVPVVNLDALTGTRELVSA